MGKLFISVALTFLMGCSAKYVAPEGNSARLRIVAPDTRTFASMRIMYYPSGTCESPQNFGMIGGIAKLKETKSLGMPSVGVLEDKKYIERHIPTDKDFMMSFRGFYNRGECTITSKFTPQLNKDYQFKFNWDSTHCHVDLVEIIENDNMVEYKNINTEVNQIKPTCGKGFN